MSSVDALLSRIDAEFSAMESRRSQFQATQVEQFHEREQREAQFEELMIRLRDVWNPRLKALAERFGERVKVTPTISPGSRQATFQFQSPVARISLRFSARTDSDVKNAILGYDLDILPILMQFEKHAEFSFPLDKVDEAAIANWFDDRIITFVKTYLALHENEFYLRDFMVEDPIAHVRFPKFAAGAKLERDGKTHYFVSDETCRQFAEK
jgi:YHS domain-containing protein